MQNLTKTKCVVIAAVLVISYVTCFKLLEAKTYIFDEFSANLPSSRLRFNLTRNSGANHTEMGTEIAKSVSKLQPLQKAENEVKELVKTFTQVSVFDDPHNASHLFHVGEEELEQLMEYERLVKYNNYSSANSKRSPSSYTFSVVDVTVTFYSLSFIIRQHRKPNVNGTILAAPLIGGASFYVTVISERHWSTCQTTDFFNGRYVVECPMYDACVSVTATVYYADFGAFYYEDLGLWDYSVLWTQAICKPDTSMSDYSVLDLTYVGWSRTHSSSNWMWVDRGTGVKSEEKLRTCLYGLYSAGVPVCFVGDSHLRMVFYYLMDLFGDMTSRIKVRDAIAFSNFNYTYASSLLAQQGTYPTFLPNAQRLLNNLIQDELQTGKQISGSSLGGNPGIQSSRYRHFIIISIGSWDVSMFSVHYFLDTVIPVLTNFTAEFQRVASTRRVKVIFLTMPACLHGLRKGHRSGPEGRNNPRIAALNRLLTDTLTGQGITVVDYFAPTILRQAEAAADGFHYPSSPGTAGDTVARMVLQELCN